MAGVSGLEVEVPDHLALAEIPDESDEAVHHGARRVGLRRDQNLAPRFE
jgi:hypothetical protein